MHFNPCISWTPYRICLLYYYCSVAMMVCSVWLFHFTLGPPGPPGVVIVEEITDTTATLSWSPGADNHSPISLYNLQARSPFSLGWQTVKTGEKNFKIVIVGCSKLLPHGNNNQQHLQEQILLREQWLIKRTDFICFFSCHVT